MHCYFLVSFCNFRSFLFSKKCNTIVVGVQWRNGSRLLLSSSTLEGKALAVALEESEAKLVEKRRLAFEWRQAIKTHSNFDKSKSSKNSNYFYTDDHYDYSLFGLDYDMDQAVGKHQRQVLAYGKYIS